MTCRLYIITPPKLDPDEFAPLLADALKGGDVACVQLRLKSGDNEAPDPEDVRRATMVLMPVAHERDVAFIINDYPELAHELGADGVHIGEDDISYDDARKIVGPDAIVGVSCYGSTHRAMEVAEKGADYVAFGAFYPTNTKPPRARPEPGLLEDWSTATNVPCVAIGGITPANAGPLVDAGADFIAVVSYVWNHPDGPGKAVAEYNAVFG